ncbi:hypothetical protein ACFY4C_17410 [Actinomadura viridis]|uniref:hypothetical protein n=1 Tax=Actinomadura viridis TaxID=58110 RepID=UPI0036BF09F3
MPVVPALAIPLNDDTVTPGFLGFGVFLALAVATFFLIRSMNKQIGRIQAPREADIKQQEWERAQNAKKAPSAETETETEPGGEGPKAAASPPSRARSGGDDSTEGSTS